MVVPGSSHHLQDVGDAELSNPRKSHFADDHERHRHVDSQSQRGRHDNASTVAPLDGRTYRLALDSAHVCVVRLRARCDLIPRQGFVDTSGQSLG
jgi:hypothetical protein